MLTIGTAQATVIDFEDIPIGNIGATFCDDFILAGNGTGSMFIKSPYPYSWLQAIGDQMLGVNTRPIDPATGEYSPALMIGSSSSPFIANTPEAADIAIEIEGLSGGVVIYDSLIFLPHGPLQWYGFIFQNIDALRFLNSGHDLFYVDNLVVEQVPEPSTILLIRLGGIGAVVHKTPVYEEVDREMKSKALQHME